MRTSLLESWMHDVACERRVVVKEASLEEKDEGRA
jgi:hypothetical protein